MDAQTPPSPRFYPPVLLLMAVVLMVVLHYVLPVARWLAWPWRACGALPIAVAVLVGFWGAVQFRRHDTTIIPFEHSTALIAKGPYRYSRNPLSISMTLILVGLWLLLGSLSPVLVAPLFVSGTPTRLTPDDE